MAVNFRLGSVFVTGSSRGIGLELVKQLAALPEPPTHIFATCRNPDSAEELRAIASKHPNVHVYKFDTVDYYSYPATVGFIEKHVGDEGLNVLINNAGILTRDKSDLAGVTRDLMLTEIELNTVAPLMLTKAFIPLLKKAAAAKQDLGLSCAKAAVINISSRLGSIAENKGLISYPLYPYRASKAALNMVTKNLSIDLKPDGILAVVLHPGHVKTDLGGANALIETNDCVSGLLKVMGGLKETDTGRFISFEGQEISW